MDRAKSVYRRLIAAMMLAATSGSAAMAQVVGAPRPWEMGMQRGFSPMKDADDLAARHRAGDHHADHAVRWRAAGLGDVALQRQAQSVPSRTSHNT